MKIETECDLSDIFYFDYFFKIKEIFEIEVIELVALMKTKIEERLQKKIDKGY